MVHTPAAEPEEAHHEGKVQPTLDPSVAAEARLLGVNMSRVAQEAVARANKTERNRQWVEENRTALDAYTAEVQRDGLPLARHRLV
jgi:antitoxin CcdA